MIRKTEAQRKKAHKLKYGTKVPKRKHKRRKK